LKGEALLKGESLWPFALEVYGRPGVEPLLLELQDAHGQCAPYLIWALWLATNGRGADDEALAATAALARAWQAAAIRPLRELRRDLKGASHAPAGRLRDGVKALELEAERMLLQMLEDASPPAEAAAPALRAGLAAAAAAWGGDPPAALLDRLAALAG
jgi:uncharacterized protein (TIGR02444 family)